MSEKNVQTPSIDGSTYEIRTFFGHQITLEEILAQRVLKDMEAESSKEPAHTACLPDELEL